MDYNVKAKEIFDSITNRKRFIDKMPSNIKQLSVAPLLAQAISRIHDDESVSSLFGFEKEMQVS